MNSANATINIRIDRKTKKEAEKTFRDMGLDISSGIKIFLREAIRSGSIPFRIRTANGFTPEYEASIAHETTNVPKNAKTYRSAKEMHAAIMKEDD